MKVSHLQASRRAHRARHFHTFGKIAEILDSEEAPNERKTTTALDQIEVKRATAGH